MELRPEVTKTSYAVEVSTEDFLAVLAHDKTTLLSRGTLFDKLCKLPGVGDVEYNGHYGPCFYYSLEAENESEHATVISEIRSYVTAARNAG